MLDTFMIFWFWFSFLIPVLMIPQAAPQAIRPVQPPESVAPGSKTATIRGKTLNAKTALPVKDVRVAAQLSGHGEVAGSATSDTNITLTTGVFWVCACSIGCTQQPNTRTEAVAATPECLDASSTVAITISERSLRR